MPAVREHNSAAEPLTLRDSRLNRNVDGLHAFNFYVGAHMFPCEGKVCEARQKAIDEMASKSGRHEDLIKLLECMKALWPHWFNGNRDRVDTDIHKVRVECKRILERLGYSDDGVYVPGGLQKLSDLGIAKTGPRGRRSAQKREYCEYHPDRRAGSESGVCTMCSSRMHKLRLKGLNWILDDDDLKAKVLAIPMVRGKGKYMAEVSRIVAEHKEVAC